MRYISVFGVIAAILLVELAGSPKLVTVGHHGSVNDMDVLGWIILGGVIVFVFYWIKFNEWAGDGQSPPGFRPRPVRHFTTWIRYLGWNTLYGLIMAAAYGAIVFFPNVILRFAESFANISEIINLEKILDLLKLDAANLSGTAQLVPSAVMLTTAVWAGMPPFSRFEKRIRLRWQENAAIPSQARQLVEAFEEDVDGANNFAPDPKIVKEVVERLDGKHLAASDFSDRGKGVWFLYARVNYLYNVLEKHNRSPAFSRLAEHYGNEFKDLEGDIDQLRKLVDQRIADILDLRDHDDAAPFAEIYSDAQPLSGEIPSPTLKNAELWLQKYLEQASRAERAYFMRQKEELLRFLNLVSKDIIQLIVCGVLVVGRSLGQRRELLASFGIKDTDRIVIQLDSVTLTWIAFSAVGIVFVASTIYLFVQNHLGHTAGPIPKDMTTVLQWSVFAGLMHLTAIGGAYVVQRAWENDREGIRTGQSRVLSPRAQVAEAVWAAVFGISINVYLLGMFTLLKGNFQSLATNWWWAAVPGVTAFFAALYTQNVQRSNSELRNLLLWQGIATGAMALLVFIVIHYKNLSGGPGAQENPYLSYLIFGFYTVVTNTILGSALGISLNIWVVAEKHSGHANRRSGIRKNYFFKRGKWRTDTDELVVRAISVSASGAELITPKLLPVKSEGLFEFSGKGIRRAKVLRNDKNNLHRIFVMFLEEGKNDYPQPDFA